MLFAVTSLVLVILLPYVTGSTLAPSLDELRQNNRITQVDGGPKPPGPVALAHLYVKYGKQAPPAVERAASAAMQDQAATIARRANTASSSTTVTTTASATIQSASVRATDYGNDLAYYVNVTVGSTQMLLNFDTGSSDLWVFSTLLPAAQRGSHNLYKPSGLSVGTFSVAYGEGSSTAGNIYNDKVVVGPVTATVQAVEAATSVSSTFITGLQDGTVGLGFIEGNHCSPNSCYGFMHQVASTVPRVLFSAALRHGAPGEYDIGFIDPTKYTGALTYTDVVDLQGGGYWEFLAGGYSIGSGALVTSSIDAIADTGTTLALVDDAIVNAFYAPVSGAVYNSTYGAVIFPCSSASQLQDLSYYINGVKKTMPGSYGNRGQISSPTGYCYGGIQSNDNVGFTILGDVFLKSQYVVFDVCLQRLGFAQQAGVAV